MMDIIGWHREREAKEKNEKNGPNLQNEVEGATHSGTAQSNDHVMNPPIEYPIAWTRARSIRPVEVPTTSSSALATDATSLSGRQNRFPAKAYGAVGEMMT